MEPPNYSIENPNPITNLNNNNLPPSYENSIINTNNNLFINELNNNQEIDNNELILNKTYLTNNIINIKFTNYVIKLLLYFY